MKIITMAKNNFTQRGLFGENYEPISNAMPDVVARSTDPATSHMAAEKADRIKGKRGMQFVKYALRWRATMGHWPTANEIRHLAWIDTKNATAAESVRKCQKAVTRTIFVVEGPDRICSITKNESHTYIVKRLPSDLVPDWSKSFAAMCEHDARRAKK